MTFKKEFTGDARIDRFQSQLDTTLRAPLALPDSANTTVTATFTAGQSLAIAHKLGKPWQGWYVTRAQGAAAALYESATQASPAQSIQLVSANAGTYTIRIF